ncbi:phosphatidate cytidylyltransferase [Desulfofalx alkaliphila]|uniref:phosphatidate cytidylyltransferase n=1 Tax=Desulfofalx alkaliphila TaxID=105483 RepID=UPI0004E20524|nr:phosphatidate cytidylyltransferase [Desulfofalx alkaliphila]
MLHLRVLSALVGIPLAVFVVWHGGLLLLGFIGLVIVLGALEAIRIFNNLDMRPNHLLVILGLLLVLLTVYLQFWPLAAITFTALLLLHMLLMLVYYPHYRPTDVSAGLFVTMYLSLLTYIYLISTLPEGRHWIFLMLVGTWASDTFAYFAGRAFGKHKLSSLISPKKTWEGAFGGVIGSLLGVYIYSYFLIPIDLPWLILLGLLISASSQIGDLVESGLKRHAKVKDSGRLIPGHGGVLDRFDSMLLSAPLVYYYVLMLII